MTNFERLQERLEEANKKVTGRRAPDDDDHRRALDAAKALADARQQAREDEGRAGLGIVAERNAPDAGGEG
jgi:hypothetical protein